AVHRFLVEELRAADRIVHPPEEDERFAAGDYSVRREDPDGIRVEVNHVPGRGHLGQGGRRGPGAPGRGARPAGAGSGADARAACRAQAGRRRFGTYRSVTVPAPTWAARPTVSESVGWGWIVRATSSTSAPISIASATSAISSPA